MPTLVKTLPRNGPVLKDSDLARQAGHQLRSVLAHGPSAVKIQIKSNSTAAITIPISAAQVLADVLEQMAQGLSVVAIPLHSELTTQAAADILHMSRPFLVSQLEKGVIPFRTVGSHRRVRLDDVLALKQRMENRRLKSLSKLSALDQKLGFV